MFLSNISNLDDIYISARGGFYVGLTLTSSTAAIYRWHIGVSNTKVSFDVWDGFNFRHLSQNEYLKYWDLLFRNLSLDQRRQINVVRLRNI